MIALSGEKLAQGLAEYGADEVQAIAGKRADEQAEQCQFQIASHLPRDEQNEQQQARTNRYQSNGRIKVGENHGSRLADRLMDTSRKERSGRQRK